MYKPRDQWLEDLLYEIDELARRPGCILWIVGFVLAAWGLYHVFDMLGWIEWLESDWELAFQHALPPRTLGVV